MDTPAVSLGPSPASDVSSGPMSSGGGSPPDPSAALRDPSPPSATDGQLFWRLGALVCLFGAATSLVDIALPQDYGVLDQVGELVSSFAVYVLVGLAFGQRELRPGLPATLASWLLLVGVAGRPLVPILDLPLGTEVMLAVYVLGITALAASLVARGTSSSHVGLGLAGLAISGAGVGAWAGITDDQSLFAACNAGMMLALAALFELARRAGASVQASASWESWRDADRGIRVVLAGERGRLIVLALLFVGGMVARAASEPGFLAWIAISAQALVIATATVGLKMLRSAPEGALWASAGFGMGLLASVGIALELLAMVLGLDSLTGLPVTGRQIGHSALAASAALAVGALGRRADDDHWTDARASASLYVGLFFLSYAAILVRDFRAPSGIVLVLGLAVIGLTIGAVLRFASLCEEVRKDLPATAAAEAFGGDAQPATGEQQAL